MDNDKFKWVVSFSTEYGGEEVTECLICESEAHACIASLILVSIHKQPSTTIFRQNEQLYSVHSWEDCDIYREGLSVSEVKEIMGRELADDAVSTEFEAFIVDGNNSVLVFPYINIVKLDEDACKFIPPTI